ncbi:MAG TPA: hypothetical protein VGR37_12335 [Longimicrobiaceae bacterium]|nr:hypothetical protein [Longimicrobiaceae bacterium]
MGDLRPVTLSLALPAEVADKVEELQRNQPEVLSQGLRYVLLRREIFDVLSTAAGGRLEPKLLT